MGGYGLTGLGGADPGSPYYDPTAMGFQPQTPMQAAMTNTQAQLAQYTPQQLAAANARGMMGANGLPIAPPSAFDVNSNGQPYTPGLNAKTTTQYFDPNDPYVNSSSSAPRDDADTPTYPTVGNEGILRKTLTGLGMNPTAQAGMLSNLYFESAGLNPAASPGAGHSTIGFAQWTGPRSLALKQFAADNGGSYLDPNVQAQFMAHEIQTKYPDLISQMNAAKSPQEAAEIALRNYEGVNPSNANTASMGKYGWDQVLSKHQQYADAFFNGKSPTAATATATAGSPASGTKNVDDTTVDTSNMPPLTNLRALASSAMVDPSTFGNGPQSQALQGLLQNPNIQRALSGQGNTSAMLARMAAGFFSGNGTHSGLAAGFGGMADQENEDQKNRLALLSGMMNNQNSLYKMGLENNMNVNRAVLQGQIENSNSLAKLKLQNEINAPYRQGMIMSQLSRNLPSGDAAVAAGILPAGDPRVAQMNASWKSGEPVPAGVSAQSQKLVQQIQDARNVQIASKTVADYARSGQFKLDSIHQGLYGLQNSQNMSSDASAKWAAANQQSATIATKLRSAFGNRMTDADLAQANSMVTGGTHGFGDNKIMANHYDQLGSQAYQSELAARKELQNLYQSRKLTATLPKDENGNPDYNSLVPPLPASPYQNTDVNNIGTNYWGDNTTNPGATGNPNTPIGQPPAGTAPTVAPATAGVGMLKTKNGLPVTYIPPSQ